MSDPGLWRRIRWVKSVTGAEDVCAYSGDDETSRAREPRGPGDRFDLHAAPEHAESLAEPAVGDLIVLTQHDQLTHLVEVTGAEVVRRPRSTIRRNSRDARYSVQRECEVVELRRFDVAPMIEEAFGFDPDAKGGDVQAIAELEAYFRSGLPLWAVQRRIAQTLREDYRARITRKPR